MLGKRAPLFSKGLLGNLALYHSKPKALVVATDQVDLDAVFFPDRLGALLKAIRGLIG